MDNLKRIGDWIVLTFVVVAVVGAFSVLTLFLMGVALVGGH